ncbi:hypothetical protein CEW91_01375 [Idiomarina piscisalsi]|uniref:Uncharacterized protein n=1 Tax=Idiomarina piscisalsi TaxID=1096243 RepID=A0ABN5AM30_9GAMM|nr:hypothetical protein [Idiomarina piscisalsi]ASG64890.1 hypothetical protein CEW91_01375 [Idiomarina piscisalsi]
MHKLFIGMATIAFSATSFAQQSGLEACAEIEDSLERLVCYDNLAKKEQSGEQQRQDRELPEQARKGKQKAAEMREKAQERREQANERFGFEHKERADTEDERISVTLADREEGPYGKWRITLTNGQVWKQTDSGYFSWDGDSYYIERGALNSFFFGREGSNRRMRVQRVK